ncbi:SDR family NAD(P)-dependent oxidoreductase [Pseudonocardia kujensis]|uniref:SDR family NAD(P)-dependent oxidoreductase n=1 Tax=Pseudonocardia kujensis TaxID=1128675 RepID=UPI001E576B6C|nr:SDR family NAD(P)-dependent oxidoreductase [Pseudonocardia kujensis]MCE0764226.1 SDR family NAD(P)-dependent oxidoreductase [Pseudonocardia kujensis]
MSASLAGRRTVGTGAASGLGAATATRLAELGASVVVCDVDRTGAARTAERIGGEPDQDVGGGLGDGRHPTGAIPNVLSDNVG